MKSQLNPWFVTGFIDGEGCFTIEIYKNDKSKTGWYIKLIFIITLHAKDKTLLEQIQKFFGVGKIYTKNNNRIDYVVSSIKELLIIIKHFENFSLITQKRADFELFNSALTLIQNKEHLTMDGLKKIVAIKASINKGLSDKFKTAFPGFIPVIRPLVIDQKKKDSFWLAGFTTGEGCFSVFIKKSQSIKIESQITLRFQLTQHERDEQLMSSLIEYFNCGNVYRNKNTFEFRVIKFDDIIDKILPLFKKYPVLGVKFKDFEDWCKIAVLMKNKSHLTPEGLEQIRRIKAGMNTGRKWSK